ncbi:MAG: FAD-dependent oxidoreductase [Elusimicrobia bacterium]|nr:FAD-dependent oxidoreductase [Elusimicrobiota bacterium]
MRQNSTLHMKVVKKKRSLGGFTGASGRGASMLRPKYVEKIPPCANACPNNNKIREALMAVSKAEAYGKTNEAALEEAFYFFLETTPFPSVCGRVCPHPCEKQCNRLEKDGSVAINSFERFVGDFGLEKNLVPRKLTQEKRSEKIAVVGSGPAGLSCAYQLSRRGYPVTVYEAFPSAGGMLRYGIPDYRLPPKILDAEISRIAAMGVDIKCGTPVGKSVSYDDLRRQYKAVFVSLGAHQGIKLRIEGENAKNVFTGTDFLHRIKAGEKLAVGAKVVTIGGGDTAIDAARAAKRLGAESVILYRRTRQEMPAIEEEIEGALEEGVVIEFLAAPLEIRHSEGKMSVMKCQRMKLGEPDASGRARPVPIEGDTFDLEFSTLIAAISQEPDFTGFENLRQGKDWFKTDAKFKTKDDNVYAGGDNLQLGLVVDAIRHGRIAAQAIHEAITGEPMPAASNAAVIAKDKIMLGYYDAKKRAEPKHLGVAERLAAPQAEIASTLAADEALTEARRCMSCGLCFDCGNCWSFCQDSAVIKPLVKGQPYKFKLEFCKGCSKCQENCPCGYIEMQ